jgi:hypothetical protein
MTTEGSEAKSAARSSQIGASDLQSRNEVSVITSQRNSRPPTSTPRCSEGHKHALVRADSLVELLVIEHLHLAWRLVAPWLDPRDFLRNELCQALQIPPTAVVYGCVALAIEPLECREPLDTKASS